jgi:hypothetical protein
VTIIHLDLDNGEGEPGDYLITGSAADPVRMGAGAAQTLSLRAKARGAASIPPVRRKRRRDGRRGRSGGLCRQDSTGSFGLWTVGGDSRSTPTFSDFLARAREVPVTACKLALDRFRLRCNHSGTATTRPADGPDPRLVLSLDGEAESRDRRTAVNGVSRQPSATLR